MLAVTGRRALAAIRAGATGIALTILLALAGCDRNPAGPEADVVRGEYIVVFKDHVQDVQGLARQLAERNGGVLLSVWEHALKGFAIRLREPARLAVARISAHPDVARIGPNHIGRYAAEQ